MTTFPETNSQAQLSNPMVSRWSLQAGSPYSIHYLQVFLKSESLPKRQMPSTDRVLVMSALVFSFMCSICLNTVVF